MKRALRSRRVALALGLAACGERDAGRRLQAGQVPGQARRAALGQRAAPAPCSGKWTKGDRGAGKTQIKQRQLAQNEDRRIYQ